MNKRSVKTRQSFQPQLKPVYAAVLLAFTLESAHANPVDATVVSGQASFATTANTLTVVNTPGTIINWKSFSIGSSEITRFVQQSASSAVLNRVIGTDPSNILGTLQSNGRVFLINPNGIAFGAGSTVDVAGLVASTLNISDADFQAGRYNFTAVPGAQNISNAGNITAQEGGQIYLIATNVENSGVITAPNGEIYLAAGSSVELVNSSDPNLRVSITAPAGDATNVGQLIASSGSLGLFGTVVKNSGTMSADSATLQGGKIVLRASARVEAGGTLSASGAGGGQIQVLADMQSGTVSVTGTLDASAPVTGDGGFIDTSAAHVQIADSARITTAAASGNSGNWLIDPTDFYISALDPLNGSSWMSNTVLSSSLAAGNVTIQTLATGVNNGDIFVNGAVSWSANKLTLNAHNNINIGANLNGSGTAQLGLEYGQATSTGGTSGYFLKNGAQVNLAAGNNFSTRAGSLGALQNYYVITSLGNSGSVTGTDLQGINGNLSGNYVLGADIAAMATAGWTGGAVTGFTPLGDGTPFTFNGRFDGFGHVITGLFINKNVGATAGLFGATGTGATIRNLGLIGATVTGFDQVGALVGNNQGSIINSYAIASIVNGQITAGGLVGLNTGTISNSYVVGGTVNGAVAQFGGLVGLHSAGMISASYVSNSTVNGNFDFGGLVGHSTASVADSYVSNTNLNGIGSGTNSVGGLVGNNNLGGSITNSYVTGGSVSANGAMSTGAIGGLVGYNSGNISTSYASNGSLTGNFAMVGGVAGWNAGTVSSVYWNTETTAVVAAFGTDMGTISNVFGRTNAEMMSGVNFFGFNFTAGTGNWFMIEGNTRPFLQSEYSTTITNAHQLQLMAMDLGANYTLGADIDMVETGTPMGMWGTGGFVPVGDGAWNGIGYNYFTGSLDGRNHIVSNLKIMRPAAWQVGLFGNLDAAASVTNLSLNALNVTGSGQVGGLAGYNAGKIDNAYVISGTVASVGSFSGTVGGLVGGNGGLITNSFVNSGIVSGYHSAGGLVGYNWGTISRSYASNSQVSGNWNIGGLIGNNGGILNDSYVSMGSVNGISATGGLVGGNSGTVNNAFYNINGVTINGGPQVTLYGLYNDQINPITGVGQYTDWFDNGLLTPLNIADYSNTLANIALNSYSLNSAAGLKDLLGFADNAAYTFSQSAAIDLLATPGVYIPYLAADFNGNNFTISNLNVNQTFSDNVGLFGRIALGSTVSNVRLLGASVVGDWNVGALTGWNAGNIVNAGSTNGTVLGFATVGGLVGTNQGGYVTAGSASFVEYGNISNSFVSGGTVMARDVTTGIAGIDNNHAGGLVGLNQAMAMGTPSAVTAMGGNISGSMVSTGSVSGWDYVGGLAGYSLGSIDTSNVTGRIVTGHDYVGGLVGQQGDNGLMISGIVSSISGSHVIGGSVTGNLYVGGLVGYSGYASTGQAALIGGSFTMTGLGGPNFGSPSYLISNSYVDTGSVSGGFYAGGLTGYSGGRIDMTHTLNTNVTATGIQFVSLGGLVGWNDGSLSNSYVQGGTVQAVAGDSVGGLVGYNTGVIDTSYATGGTVIGVNAVGGLVGGNFGLLNAGSVSAGDITGNSIVGGLVGQNIGVSSSGSTTGAIGAASISNSFVDTGTVVNGMTNVGGLVGTNGQGSATVSGTAAVYSFSGANILNSYVDTGTVVNGMGPTPSGIGGLVGWNGGGIYGSHASASVTGSGFRIGGLVGSNDIGSIGTSGTWMSFWGGTISNSFVQGGTVQATIGEFRGGLVGWNAGVIDKSYVVNSTISTLEGFAVGGLVGYHSGMISKSFVLDSSVSSSMEVGGLVGQNNGTVIDSHVSGGSVDGVDKIGGLVGHNIAPVQNLSGWSVGGGSIINSYVDSGTLGMVVTGTMDVGGLAGFNQSSIQGSSVIGVTVNGMMNVGGLVGQNLASNGGIGKVGVWGALSLTGLTGLNAGIGGSFVSGGSVSGGDNVGGLVGLNMGGTGGAGAAAITVSAAVGAGGAGGSANVNSSFVSGGMVSGSGMNVGGLIGLNVGGAGGAGAGAVSVGLAAAGGAGGSAQLFFSYVSGGTVTAVGNNAGGLVGSNAPGAAGPNGVGTIWAVGGPGGLANINASYANNGSVSGAANVGAVVGNNTWMVVNTYWNSAITGVTSGIGMDNAGGPSNVGATPLTLTQMMTMSSYAGWSIANIGGAGVAWRIYEGYTMPLLTTFLKPLNIAADPVAVDYTGAVYTGGLVNPVYTSNGVTPVIVDPTHILGSAYGNAVNVGVYTPVHYSDQLGYDITFVNGALSINPVLLALSVTANDATKTYGTTYTFTGTEFTSAGLVGTDTIGSVTLSSTGAVNTANAGSYAITPSNAVFSSGLASNYSITYVDGTLTVTPAPLTVTADPATKIYGDLDPVFTYQTTGLLFTDVLSGGLSRVAGQNVGTYAITRGTLANPNYVISYVGNLLTITARAVDIIASASTKVYGDADPNLFTVGGAGLASWDTQSKVFSGSLGHSGGENVGTYTGAITIGSLAANANYTIATFTTSDLTITPATLTVVANDMNKVLTTTDPLLTYTVYGLKLADTAATTLTGELVRVAGETVGTYQIDQGTVTVISSNYSPTYTYVPGVFTILAPTVINEIVDISLQNTGSATTEEEKKAAQTVVADAAVTTETTETQGLPVCQ